jgi:hypothetical protein
VCYLLRVLTITHRPIATFALAAAFTLTAAAQAANESLGPADSHGKVKGTPLLAEMKSLHSSLRPELAGVHPRVYFTSAELDTLRTKVHGPAAAEWHETLANLRVFRGDPPPPPAEKRRAQNDVAFAIAEGAFAYQMERDPKILAATKRYMDAAVSYDVWGYAFSKPNTDLAAGHLLYGMGVAYDLLYNDLTPAERDKYRASIARHGRLLYDFFAPKSGRAYAYSQNHTFIPMSGLAVAAYAVYGEVPEAAQWSALSRAIYDRVLATYSQDGYYYEGYEYWIFATPWIIHYLDAQKHATGEDLFNQPGLRQTHLYAAHALLPGGQSMFDFGDVFDGPVTRAKQGEDYERSHPNGHFESNYNILYDLAARFRSPEIQGVADWMKSQGHTGQEPWWTLVWHDASLPSQPITKLEPFHRFPDHDVAFWRSSWSADATAVAFKCGPPEGHHTAAAVAKYPDFHTEQGHVHPDVASFILFAHGQYLTGDSGYAGVPKTVEHNTLLVDGHGQGNEGSHDAWAHMDEAQLDHIQITSARFTSTGFDITGEAAAAYAPALGLTHFTRRIQLTKPGQLEVSDSIATSAPRHFSEVLHTDTTFKTDSANTHTTTVGSATLHIADHSSVATTAHTESNIVMGPGRPGSVDKGTPEARGERLQITTDAPVNNLAFTWQLTF